MELASFTGFIRTISIIILSVYAIRFLMRLLAPVIVQQVVKKAEQQMYNRHQENNKTEYRNTTKEKEPEKKKVGEYIDFEEID